MEGEHFSATQIAYDGIRRMIFVTHELRPGQKLVESTVAQKLCISRTPVREAIHRLQQDGILERIPNRGSFVCIPKKRDIVHSYEIVAALSAMSCYIIAEAVSEGRDLSEIFQSLDDACEAMDAASAEGNRELWLMLDRDFHYYIAVHSGNERLTSLFRHAHEMVYHDVWQFPSRVIDADNSCREHHAIVDAMRAGETIRAHELELRHMMRTRETIRNMEFE